MPGSTLINSQGSFLNATAVASVLVLLTVLVYVHNSLSACFSYVYIYTHTLYVQHHACSHIIPPRLNTAGKSTWVVPSLWNTFEQSQLYSCPSGQGAGCLANWKEPCWALPGSKSSQEGFSGQSRCCRSAWALVMFDHKGQTDLSFQAFSLSRIPD